MSDFSGTLEVYVTPFPDATSRHKVSTDGGNYPAWSSRGDEIFYVSGGNTFFAVDVTPDPAFRVGSPKKIFEIPYRRSTERNYDVSHDGERFAVVTQDSSADLTQEINVVVNWLEELNERVPIE